MPNWHSSRSTTSSTTGRASSTCSRPRGAPGWVSTGSAGRVATRDRRSDLEEDSHGDSNSPGLVSGAVLGRLSGPAAEPADNLLPNHHGHSDRDRARCCLRSDLAVVVGRPDRDRRSRWSAVLRSFADDPVPAQVPEVVVRLESGAAAFKTPVRNLPPAHGDRLPVNRQAQVGELDYQYPQAP